MTAEQRPQQPELPHDPFPQLISPMLLHEMVFAPRPEDLKDWIFEPKWNGVRGILYIPPKQSGGIRLLTRTGRDIINNFPEIYQEGRRLQQRHNIILDGEIIYKNGRTQEERITVTTRINYPKPTDPLVKPCNLVVFDIPYLDNKNLTSIPLLERKRLLDKLFSRYPESRIGRTRYAASPIDISRLFLETEGFENEGIVVKKKESPYIRGKRSRAWQKLKFPLAENPH